jgi:hypothetical protein
MNMCMSGSGCSRVHGSSSPAPGRVCTTDGGCVQVSVAAGFAERAARLRQSVGLHHLAGLLC